MCISSKKAWFHSHDDVIGAGSQIPLTQPQGNNWIYYVIPPEQGELFRKVRQARLNAKPLPMKPQKPQLMHAQSAPVAGGASSFVNAQNPQGIMYTQAGVAAQKMGTQIKRKSVKTGHVVGDVAKQWGKVGAILPHKFIFSSVASY